METYDEIYNAFLKALRHFLDKEGHGGRAYLAAKAGVSSSMISLMLSRPNRTKASMKTQVALAKACGHEHSEFIALGRNLLAGMTETEVPSIPVVSEVIEQTVLTSDYVEELKQQVKDLRSERDGLRADKAYWIAQSEEWKAERTELKNEIAELKERIRNLEAQISTTAESDVKKSAS